MIRGISNHDFVDPLILKILKESGASMTTLAINYRVNQSSGGTINLRIIKDHLTFLVDKEKISKSMDKFNDVAYYKIIV
jgi:repressor of nif and glnA expression